MRHQRSLRAHVPAAGCPVQRQQRRPRRIGRRMTVTMTLPKVSTARAVLGVLGLSLRMDPFRFVLSPVLMITGAIYPLVSLYGLKMLIDALVSGSRTGLIEAIALSI